VAVIADRVFWIDEHSSDLLYHRISDKRREKISLDLTSSPTGVAAVDVRAQPRGVYDQLDCVIIGAGSP